MKILHVVAGELSGGAARGAHWLHNGLLSLNVDSKLILSGKVNTDDASIVSLSNNNWGLIKTTICSKFDPLLLKIYKNRKGDIFSTGFVGIDITKYKEYKEADIIHLHWINSGLINMKHLNKIDKPIIWTLRDMWPFTGGCHYALDCDGFMHGCGSCPQLGSELSFDLSRLVYKRKLKYIPKNLTAVGISNWITNKAKRSNIFKENKCTTISNNINTQDFQRINKIQARQILGIETDKKIVLCGSTNVKDFYKGFQKYLGSLKYLNQDEILLCFFGQFDSTLMKDYSFEFKSFGYLNDNISLNLVYAAADVFVAPSIQEAFGKTLVEAQSSGTPVVCFDATGPKDLVDHLKTGYKAKPFETEDLANGIDWIINASNYDELCQNARNKVLKEFDSKVIARKYINLYKQVL